MKIRLPSNKHFKRALWLVGVIFIGAISSGIWEVVLKPLSTFIRDMLLNLITLGLDSFRNNIYSSIANGYNQSPMIELLYYFVLIIIFAMIMLLVFLFSEKRELLKERNRLVELCDDKLSELDNKEEPRKKTIEEIREGIVQTRQKAVNLPTKRYSFLLYFISVIFVFEASLLITSYIKTSYINSAITHYNKIVAISSPYYNTMEIALHTSQYAQIKKKEDYIRLTSSIEATIKNHGIVPPTFSVW